MLQHQIRTQRPKKTIVRYSITPDFPEISKLSLFYQSLKNLTKRYERLIKN